MGIDWSKYPSEKKRIKLKYLELLKKNYKNRSCNMRDEVTDWAIKNFPYLKIPKRQFAGTFDHSGHGFFMTDHNVSVTQKSIEETAGKRGISESSYISELISMVKDS